MNVYHYSVKYNNCYSDGLLYSNNQIMNDEEYRHMKRSLMKALGWDKIEVLSFTYLGYKHTN